MALAQPAGLAPAILNVTEVIEMGTALGFSKAMSTGTDPAPGKSAAAAFAVMRKSCAAPAALASAGGVPGAGTGVAIMLVIGVITHEKQAVRERLAFVVAVAFVVARTQKRWAPVVSTGMRSRRAQGRLRAPSKEQVKRARGRLTR